MFVFFVRSLVSTFKTSTKVVLSVVFFCFTFSKIYNVLVIINTFNLALLKHLLIWRNGACVRVLVNVFLLSV